MSPPWILRRLTNVSSFFNSLSNRLRNQVNISNHSEKKVITTKYLAKFQSPMAVSWPKIIQPEWISKLICNLWLYTHTKNQVNISNHTYLAKFQSPRTITRPKIIGPERNINLICNLSLYIHIPNIKSIWWQLFYFGITEWRTWVTLYVPAT